MLREPAERWARIGPCTSATSPRPRGGGGFTRGFNHAYPNPAGTDPTVYDELVKPCATAWFKVPAIVVVPHDPDAPATVNATATGGTCSGAC